MSRKGVMLFGVDDSKKGFSHCNNCTQECNSERKSQVDVLMDVLQTNISLAIIQDGGRGSFNNFEFIVSCNDYDPSVE